jgi:phospholipase C
MREPRPFTRRAFLAATGAAIAAPLVTGRAAVAAPRRGTGPWLVGRARRTSAIKQIVVSCQENRSFDHYFGSSGRLPAGYGIPKGYTNSGVHPFRFSNLFSDGFDPYHDWTSIHEAYDGGRMDGFVRNGNGRDAMGYFTAGQLPYYYSLLPEFTLCAEYFSGMLTETLPNRMVLYAGTSGGITNDAAPANGTISWPCITHVLGDAGISYKNYNFHAPANYSYLCLWKGNNGVARLNQSSTAFFSDCRNGRLPQVSWIEKQSPWDEHPPANIQTGEKMMEGIIRAVQAGPQWESTVILHTYDEGGGYFDHRPPRELDAFGSGIRVPMLVISPLAKRGAVDTTYSDHASVLKLIEHVFGLPTLASVNHEFDRATPRSAGQGGGRPFPPRDGNPAISNLTQCFSVDV